MDLSFEYFKIQTFSVSEKSRKKRRTHVYKDVVCVCPRAGEENVVAAGRAS